MKEIKKAKITVHTTFKVSGKLASYYDGPALIHDEVEKVFEVRKEAESFCKKQDWLNPEEDHITPICSYDIIEVEK